MALDQFGAQNYVGEDSTTTNFKGWASLTPSASWGQVNTSVPDPTPEVQTSPEITAVTDRYQNVTVEEGGDGDQQRMLDNAGQGTRAYSQMSPSGMLDMDGRALSGLGSAFDQVSKVTDPIKNAVTNQFDKATSFLPDMPQSLKDTAKSLSMLGGMASPQGLLTGMLAGVNYEDKFGYNQNLSGIVASIAGLQSGISPQGYSASFKESMAAASQGKTTEQLRAAIEAGLIKSVGVHSLGGATMYEPTEKGLRRAKAYRDNISMSRAIAEGLYGRKTLGTDQFGKDIDPSTEGGRFGGSPNGNGWTAEYDKEGNYVQSVQTNHATGRLNSQVEQNLRGTTLASDKPTYGPLEAFSKSREQLDLMIDARTRLEQEKEERRGTSWDNPDARAARANTLRSPGAYNINVRNYKDEAEVSYLDDSVPQASEAELSGARDDPGGTRADDQAEKDAITAFHLGAPPWAGDTWSGGGGDFDFGPDEGTAKSAAEEGGLEEGQFEGEAQGGMIRGKRYQTGGGVGAGMIRGPGSATSDSIPMKADPGDFILNAAAVKYFGQDRIQKDIARAIRKIAKPGFAVGGAPDNIGSTPIRVSNGEMFIPKELKGAFGEDKLNRMNDYGKSLMARGGEAGGYKRGGETKEYTIKELGHWHRWLMKEGKNLLETPPGDKLDPERYKRFMYNKKAFDEEVKAKGKAEGGALRGTPRTHGYHNAVLPGTGYADGDVIEGLSPGPEGLIPWENKQALIKPHKKMFDGLTDDEKMRAILPSKWLNPSEKKAVIEQYYGPNGLIPSDPAALEWFKKNPQDLDKHHKIFIDDLENMYIWERFFNKNPVSKTKTWRPELELARGGEAVSNKALTGYADGAAVEEGYNEYSIMDVLSRVIGNIFGVEDDTPQGSSLTGEALRQVIESLDPARNPLPPDPEDDGTLLPREPPPFDEQEFQTGVRDTDWFRQFVDQYGEEPDLRPMSENPEAGPNYDYRKAWAAGIRPTPNANDAGRYHWPSSPGGGEMLKSKSHPTTWKEHFMRQYGVDPDTLPPEEIERLRGGGLPQGFTIQRGPELDPRERNIREMQDFRVPGDDPEFQGGNGFISGGELQGIQGNRFGALYEGAARAQTPGGQPSLSGRDPRETQGFVPVPGGVTDNVELSNIGGADNINTMKDFIYKKEGAFNKKYNVGGDKYKSYWDPLANKGKGAWTMPGGLTTERGFSVTETTIKTKTEIKAEMNRRVSRNDAWFSKKYGKKYDDLNINQKTALNSLVHNAGRAAFGGDSIAGVTESKASKAFKRGDMETFKLEAFGKNSWSYNILKSRRDSEMAKWNTPVN